MGEEAVHQILGDRVRDAAQRRQPTQDEPGVQRQKLESAVDPVGRGQRLVQLRAARRSHDLASNLLDECFAGAPRAPLGQDHTDILRAAACALLWSGLMS